METDAREPMEQTKINFVHKMGTEQVKFFRSNNEDELEHEYDKFLRKEGIHAIERKLLAESDGVVIALFYRQTIQEGG